MQPSQPNILLQLGPLLVLVAIFFIVRKTLSVKSEQSCLRCGSAEVHIKKRGFSFLGFAVCTIISFAIIVFGWGFYIIDGIDERTRELLETLFENASGFDIAIFFLKAWGTTNPLLLNVEYNLINIVITLVIAVCIGLVWGSIGMNDTMINCLKCDMEWYPGQRVIRWPWYKGQSGENQSIPVATNSKQSNEPTAVSVSKTANSTKCTQCDNEIGVDEKFCSSCGIEIKREKCKQCDNELKPNEKFCAECGTKIEEEIKNTLDV